MLKLNLHIICNEAGLNSIASQDPSVGHHAKAIILKTQNPTRSAASKEGWIGVTLQFLVS